MKLRKMIGMLLCMCVAISTLIPATVMASDDTDGSEIKVIEPEALEIQLGPEWAGVEFQLKTDAGLYPNPIPVGEDGFLRLEIGGSSKYILSCLGSSVAVPEPDAAKLPNEKSGLAGSKSENTSEPEDVSVTSENKTEDETQNTEASVEERTVLGIPVKHAVFFCIVLIVAVLIFVAWLYNRRSQTDFDDNNELWDDEEF